jgi:CubicO group peptidase (beta-lactamase class C family)
MPYLLFALCLLSGLIDSSIVYGALPTISAQEAGYDQKKLEAIREKVDALYEDGRIPNYVVALAKDGKVFYQAIRGEATLGKPETEVDLDTIFWLASKSKPIVSTAAFQLIEEEKLRLSDKLSDFFPIFEDLLVAPGGSFESAFEELARDITVRDLLTHTAGFTYGESIIGLGDVAKQYDELGVMSMANTLDDNLLLLAEVPLIAQPGESFNYSVGIDVLGAIMEKIEGKRLSLILRERVFDPLGMTNSGFNSDDFSEDGIIASLYSVPGPGQRPIGRIEGSAESVAWRISESPLTQLGYPDSVRFDSGGGGLWASADNFLRYAMMIANDGILDGQRVLKPESVQSQLTNLVPGLDLNAFMRNFGEAARLMSFGGGLGIKREDVDTKDVDYYFWGGLCNTSFWIDPKDGSVGVFFTHHCPGQYNINDELEDIVDGARF